MRIAATWLFVLSFVCVACGGGAGQSGTGALSDAAAADAAQDNDLAHLDAAALDGSALDVAVSDSADVADATPPDASGTDAAADVGVDAPLADADDVTPAPDATDATDVAAADALPDAGGDGADLEVADAGADADAGPTPLGLNMDVTLTSPLDGAVVTVGSTITVAYALDVEPPLGQWTLTVTLSNAATAVATESLDALPKTHSLPVTITQAGPQILRLRIWQDGVLVAEKSVNLIGNLAPTGTPVVAITPNPATVQADLQASVLQPSVDPEGATLTWNWQWMLNNQPTTFAGPVVPQQWLKKGQAWTVLASASDGYASGPSAQASAMVVNSPPSPVVLGDDPTSVELTGTVTATVLAPSVDADGDPVTTTWSWTWQGQEIGTSPTLQVPTVLVNGAHLTPGALLLTVTSSDGDGGLGTVQRAYTIVAAPVCGTAWWLCDAHAACTDNATLTPPCVCQGGWTGDGKSCTDIDECATAPCSANAKCANSLGSFSCSCFAGFAGNGFVCSDIDECSDKTANCSVLATCKNTSGSFTCTCPTGFAGDGTQCTDINECKIGTANCDANATCSNNDGGFSCKCNAGWAGNGVACADVNECLDPGLNACDAHADCLNSDGGYDCKCKAGWSGSGLSCSDIDECQAGTAGCASQATCANTVGSFSCTCKGGYNGDGKTCTDIDECKAGTAVCDANATCGNTVGAYVCACNAGFVGSGKSCAALCDLYCSAVTANCTGASQQYADLATCEATCKINAAWATGQVGDTSGDSVACRYTQANSASMAPATFCSAAGASGGNVCGGWCDGYCDLMTHSCSGTYATATDCQSACAAFPSNGAIGATTGDSVQCRSGYALLAPGSASPAAYCGNAAAVSSKCTAAIDISGWKLEQATSTQSYTVPAGTTVVQGGYVIIARASSRADFETFWGVTLGSNVTFLQSAPLASATTFACPQINGDETYTLRHADATLVEGPTTPMTSGGKFIFSRSDPTQSAGLASAWSAADYTVKTNATPGSGQKPGLVNGAYISEFADAAGTNNYVYEFVEIYFDTGP